MQFPCEIQAIINEYAKPASAMLREDWREGSSIIKHLKADRWWSDYMFEYEGLYPNEESWIEWCKDKMIIGPPRHRSSREEAELDDSDSAASEFVSESGEAFARRATSTSNHIL